MPPVCATVSPFIGGLVAAVTKLDKMPGATGCLIRLFWCRLPLCYRRIP